MLQQLGGGARGGVLLTSCPGHQRDEARAARSLALVALPAL